MLNVMKPSTENTGGLCAPSKFALTHCVCSLMPNIQQVNNPVVLSMPSIFPSYPKFIMNDV